MKPALQVCLLLLLCSCTVHATEELDERFDRDTLIIVTNKRACHRFDIYLALSFEQQRRGLMFVRKLPEMSGMLFVYDGEDYHSMWMKNTFIPLDIAFARADGTISNIAKNTEPQSLESIRSTEPVRFVLELNAGVTEKYGIDHNSHLVWEGVNDDDE